MRLTPRAILVIAILLVVLYGYPGLMTADSVDQLDMMRRWDLGDWQPPMSAVIWRIVEVFVAGPFGMLVIQTVTFVTGGYLVLRDRMAPKRAAWVVLAICAFPPILATLGVIWKDTQMAGYLILGIGLLLANRRRTRWFGLGLLFLASAMRHNAAAATLAPILMFWAPGVTRWRRLGYAALAWIAITAASFAINTALADRSEHPWTRSIATTDIVGTVRWAPPISDAVLIEALRGAPLRVDHDLQASFVAHYNPVGWNVYQSADPPLALPTTDAEDQAIARAWKTIVTAYPAAYLHHRWTVFARLIELDGRPGYPVTTTFNFDRDPELSKRVHLDATPSSIQRVMFAIQKYVVANRVIAICFAPIIYFVIACILVIGRLIGRWRSRRVIALVASGLVYELSFFIAAPSGDYRYSHWMMTTTLLATAIVIAERYSQSLMTPRSSPSRARESEPTAAITRCSGVSTCSAIALRSATRT